MKSRLSFRKADRSDDPLDSALTALRDTPVPAHPADLLDRLVPPSVLPKRSRKQNYWLAAGVGAAAVATVAIVEQRSPSNRGLTPVAHGERPLSRHTLEGTNPPQANVIATREEHTQAPTVRPRQPKPVLVASRHVDDDLAFLNPEQGDLAPNFAGIASYRPAKLPPMRDDFVAPPLVEYASVLTEAPTLSAEELKRYRQEAAIVDERLFKNVSFAMKHASMEEVCAELSRQTGVHISAGRNVKDENATLFVKPRPAREVMREISRIFGFTWEREEDDGKYSYRLKQDTASQIAEEKLRNSDIAAAIQALTRVVRNQGGSQNSTEQCCKAIFSELLPDEMERLQSGQVLNMTTSGSEGSPDLIDSAIGKRLIASMGGIVPYMDNYMATGMSDEPGETLFSSMKNPGSTVGFRLKITEFGGASLSADVTVHGSTDKFPWTGTGTNVALGKVAGVAEETVGNAKQNALLKSAVGMDKVVTLTPNPTLPVSRQTQAAPDPQIHTIATMIASYRLIKELQPPRPYMTSDDYWQAVHETTGRDVIADSYTRLFKLRSYHESEFDTLSNGCDEMGYKWSVDDGFLVGRSRAYYWQRLSEIPKSALMRWSKRRTTNGFLPLDGVLEMSQMSDRQLDAIEVGKAIVNEWNLPEWGIPSRPMWHLANEPIRPMCRALAALDPEQVNSMLQGSVLASTIGKDKRDAMRVDNIGPDTLVTIHYVPPGKYYWNPLFELGKETVHGDLIVGDTIEEVEAEARKRYPEIPGGQVTLSDGVLGLVIQNGTRLQAVGDSLFGEGHRGPIG